MKNTLLLIMTIISVLAWMNVSEARADGYTVEEFLNTYNYEDPCTGSHIFDIRGLDINETGMIVGYQKNLSDYPRPIVIEDGIVSELPRYSGGYRGVTYGINNLIPGDPNTIRVCGYVPTRVGVFDWHMTLWTQGPEGFWPLESATDLGALPGEDWCVGYDINDKGAICGGYNSTIALYLQEDAYGLSAGMNSLGSLGGEAIGYGINEHGEVVGQSQDGSSAKRAVVWLPSAAHGLPAGLSDLNVLGSDSMASAINDAGQITGYSLSGQFFAFIWEDGVRTNLPKPPNGTSMTARDINNSGVIVGSVDITGVGRRGFIWDSVNGTQIPPEFDSWVSCEFQGISDGGKIGGYGTNSAGEKVAFLLEPILACGDWGYLKTDLNEDCFVNIEDLSVLAYQWLMCTDPADVVNCQPAL